MYSTVYDDEEAQARREAELQKKLARLLSEGADDWRNSLRPTSAINFVAAILGAVLLAANGELLFPGLMFVWATVMFILHFKASCCRTTGLIAFGLSLAGTLIMPGAGVLATPFYQLPLCHNASARSGGGAGMNRLYGLQPAGGGATSPSGECPAAAAEPLQISLGKGDLDADRHYRGVLLLPSGSHASLILTVLDAAGRQLFVPTRLDLGPDENFESLNAVKAIGAGGAAATAAAAGASAGAASIPATGAAFDASSRRNRRRLRGFGGLMRMGGGGFSRGTGSFMSPHRGISQGPRMGTPSRAALGGARVGAPGAPGAVGRPGATYFQHTPFAGGGYRPVMGYNPSLGFDIVRASPDSLSRVHFGLRRACPQHRSSARPLSSLSPLSPISPLSRACPRPTLRWPRLLYCRRRAPPLHPTPLVTPRSRRTPLLPAGNGHDDRPHAA